jgi:hypothetical protein
VCSDVGVGEWEKGCEAEDGRVLLCFFLALVVWEICFCFLGIWDRGGCKSAKREMLEMGFFFGVVVGMSVKFQVGGCGR